MMIPSNSPTGLSVVPIPGVGVEVKATFHKAVNEPGNWIIGDTAKNLLTANQSNAEVDTAGMASYWGTLSRTTTVDEFYAGIAGFKDVATSINTMTLYSTFRTVTPTERYCFSVYLKSSTVVKNWRVFIDWYTAGDVYISQSGSAAVAASATFVRLFVSGLAPATAAKCIVKIQLITPAIGDILYADNLMVEQASVVNVANIIGTLGLNGVPIGAIESITRTILTENYTLTNSETTILTQNITLSAQRYCLFLCKAYVIVGANSSVDVKLYVDATPIQDVLTGLTEVITTSLPLITYNQLTSGAHTIYLKGYYAGISGQVSGDAGGMDTQMTTIVFTF
jgi:hypothetical protein